MLDLLFIMLERVGMIIAVAFTLTRFHFFKEMIQDDKLKHDQQLKAMIFFGVFGIAGTYLGFTLDVSTLQFSSALEGVVTEEAIANSRVIGVVIAGLLGGYRVGLGAGLIAGLHRMMLGGFTAFSCGISTIISGFLSGYFYKKKDSLAPAKAMFISAIAEALQMSLILLISSPFEESFALVKVIGLPMILVNGIGAGIFMLIVQTVISDGKKTSALEAEKTLRIADQTISHLRKGLTISSAEEVCKILFKELNAAGVAMTNKTNILAHVGKTHGSMAPNSLIQTEETKEVLRSGQIKHLKPRQEKRIGSLGYTIIAPLIEKDQTIGTLKIYYHKLSTSESMNVELIKGLSKLLSEQLEIGEAERTLQLAKEAEINALQAQINPHFLFNSINIIVSLIRTNPEEARTLLKDLSFYIRKNVTGTSDESITLKEELAHVKAYLAIIEARFIDRLHIRYALDFTIMDVRIPPLVLQPLIENAIYHGFRDKDMFCELTISVVEENGFVTIKVIDNGIGISEDRIQHLLHQKVESKTGTGIGLYNVNRRLIMNYGKTAMLHIKSKVNKGTEVKFTIEIKEDIHASSLNY